MSHFSQISIKFKDQACLVEALQRFGFYPNIHDKPVHLYGWLGDKREQVAHIIVPRNQISNSSNDLGFFWDGTEYQCFISEYDQNNGRSHHRLGLGPKFLTNLQAQYINLYLPKLALQMGGEVVKTETIGSVTTVRVVLPDQQHIRR